HDPAAVSAVPPVEVEASVLVDEEAMGGVPAAADEYGAGQGGTEGQRAQVHDQQAEGGFGGHVRGVAPGLDLPPDAGGAGDEGHFGGRGGIGDVHHAQATG